VRDLDVKTLRLFVAVCEHRTMARAAEQEHIEPSAISKRIAQLETDLGVELLMRGRRGVQPTPAGLALLDHARTVLFTMGRIADDAAAFSETGGIEGHVRLVATASAIAESLLDDIAAFMREPANRNIKVEQIRDLGEFLSLTPALSPWRVVIIDTLDDLEASGANALLKILEEPPPNTLFLLVSHAPGRLLPTIRSRCRRLDFQNLGDDAMTSVLEAYAPDLAPAERARIVTMSGGSAGRALAFAELGLAKLEDAALAILRQGDPTNARRSEMAQELGKKNAADRYAAFLDLAPCLIAREARKLDGVPRERALEAYSKARELAAIAPRLSLDPAATVFQIGGILAEVAEPASLKR